MRTAQRLPAALSRVRTPHVRARHLARATPISLYGDPYIVVQPIVAVSTGAAVAMEALARFPDNSDTEQVFDTTRSIGRGPALEAACVRAALDLRPGLPPRMLLNINVSPNALDYVAEHDIWPDDLTGVVVEVTEHDVHNTVDMADSLADLRRRGAAVAIDDVTSGYAGLLRLAQIRPDYVKIDRRVVAGVGDSFAQSAVLEALVTLSHRLGAAVIAEGVEDLADLAALTDYDVDYVQGYAIALPASDPQPIGADVVAACRASRRQLLRGQAARSHAAARTRDVYAVTAALGAVGGQSGVRAIVRAAADELGVDTIGVSILGAGLTLREVATSGTPIDGAVYSLAEFPATLAAISDDTSVEVQLADSQADAAEAALMRQHGYASLLMVAIRDRRSQRTVGVLEFAHHTARRWTSSDLAHARGLADHLCPVLQRVGVGAPDDAED